MFAFNVSLQIILLILWRSSGGEIGGRESYTHCSGKHTNGQNNYIELTTHGLQIHITQTNKKYATNIQPNRHYSANSHLPAPLCWVPHYQSPISNNGIS